MYGRWRERYGSRPSSYGTVYAGCVVPSWAPTYEKPVVSSCIDLRDRLLEFVVAKLARLNIGMCLARLAARPWVFFLILALIVLGPLLLPGRILTLDSPLALNWDTASYFSDTS